MRKWKALAGAILAIVVTMSALVPGAGAADSSVGTGQGVTPTTIKLGLVQVDYSCIKDFVDFNRGDQKQTYQVFVDDLNAKGGILGRKVEGVFRSFCPVGNAQALSACTSFTEDDKVFAVVGVFIDQTGDAQLCIAKNHKTVEIIHNVSQSWIDQAPKGLLLTPNITTDRRLNVILDLLAQRKTLKGKKVAVLTQADSQDRVEQLVDPALKKMKVAAGDHRGAEHHRHRHDARRSRNSTASSNAGRVRGSMRSSSPGRSSSRRRTSRSSRTRSRRRRSSPTRRRRRCRAVRTRSRPSSIPTRTRASSASRVRASRRGSRRRSCSNA